jgi:two-component sensor histidine kinase
MAMNFLNPKRPNGHRVSFARDNAILDREADHRIANNLGLINSLLRLRARSVAQGRGKMERAEVSGLLEDIAARVDTVAKLHRLLSQSHRHTEVDVGGYLRELAASITGSLSPQAKVGMTHHAGEFCTLAPDQVLTLGMLVSELITNAVKYAHPSGLPVKIEISCRELDTGGVAIEIADDGIGLPENFDPDADGNLGLRVVRSLATQLGATISFASSPLGTRARLELPASG